MLCADTASGARSLLLGLQNIPLPRLHACLSPGQLSPPPPPHALSKPSSAKSIAILVQTVRSEWGIAFDLAAMARRSFSSAGFTSAPSSSSSCATSSYQ
eukprot:2758693-Rhodomonas_salina.1